jgi:hypothetical protein
VPLAANKGATGIFDQPSGKTSFDFAGTPVIFASCDGWHAFAHHDAAE